MSYYRAGATGVGLSVPSALEPLAGRVCGVVSGVGMVRVAEKRFYQRGIGVTEEPRTSTFLDGVLQLAQDVSHVLLLIGGAWTVHHALRR